MAQRVGICNLPLHSGTCPRWLFPRMKKLAGAISEVLIYEFCHEEFLKRLANPFWFQALGCVIAYDWHSSGLTTTTMAAIKESVNNQNLGIKIAGGKGKTSRRTLEEIENTDFNNQSKIMTMTPRHTIIDMDKRNIETLKKAHELQPETYGELVAIKGVGAKTIRSLALISELVYGAQISWKDPVKYSFAFGGKDRIHYEIDRKHYDNTTEILKNAIQDAKLGEKEKLGAIRRLSSFYA